MSDWRHLTEKEIKDLISENADPQLARWADYHLKDDGHSCKRCKELIKQKKPD